MWELIEVGLKERFLSHPAVTPCLAGIAGKVERGELAAQVAARELLSKLDCS